MLQNRVIDDKNKQIIKIFERAILESINNLLKTDKILRVYDSESVANERR